LKFSQLFYYCLLKFTIFFSNSYSSLLLNQSESWFFMQIVTFKFNVYEAKASSKTSHTLINWIQFFTLLSILLNALERKENVRNIRKNYWRPRKFLLVSCIRSSWLRRILVLCLKLNLPRRRIYKIRLESMKLWFNFDEFVGSHVESSSVMKRVRGKKWISDTCCRQMMIVNGRRNEARIDESFWVVYSPLMVKWVE
jgi:hypothetical protein